MIVYRLCSAAFASRQLALNGEGAALHGQRWNARGQRAAYFASSRALCALEYLVHIDDVGSVPELRMLRLEVAANTASLHDFSSGKGLPHAWKTAAAIDRCQQFGNSVLTQPHSLGFKIPSALIPAEWNVVLNPDFAAFRASIVSFRSEGRFVYDPRFFEPGRPVFPAAE
ncbi:MAG: RES family NAD+ phosphorylase [Pseudomonadota bacterium]|nr:RES family NAD+ phosphorylase [Pseudomonadota bacterium]